MLPVLLQINANMEDKAKATHPLMLRVIRTKSCCRSEKSEAELWDYTLEDQQEFATKWKVERAETVGQSEWLPQSTGIESWACWP